MTNFRIDVASDFVCPWCYVGRKQLLRATQMWHQANPDSGDTFEIRHSPFQLNPHFPRGPASSTDKEQYYLDKFGAARTEQIHERLLQVGREVGIDFKFGGRTGNSRDAHRLASLAKRYGSEADSKTIDGLMSSFFENEGDITSYDNLQKIAVAAGIPEDAFKKAIVDGDEEGSRVDQDVKRAQMMGIHGVPNFIVQDRYQLNGARDPLAFLRVFERVKSEA